MGIKQRENIKNCRLKRIKKALSSVSQRAKAQAKLISRITMLTNIFDLNDLVRNPRQVTMMR